VNITATFPLNKVMFRQQLYGINVSNAIRQLRREGWLNLYRGVMPPLMQKTTSLSIMFGTYHQYQSLLQSHAPVLSNRLNKSGAAFLAGTTEALLAPFERVQTLLQDKSCHQPYKNTWHALKSLRVYGMTEYYRGLSPVLLRNGPSNILFFVFRGDLKECLPTADSASGNILADFISGGLLGAFISTLFFPVNVVKTKMQSSVGGPFPGMWVTFVAIMKERDYRLDKLYRGVHVNYTRSIISWGLINASYEIFKSYLYPVRSPD